jgi:Acyl-CoA carboxylase epsilon subunit
VKIAPTPTDEEVAAIAAAIAVVEQSRAVPAETPDDTLHLWVEASRRSAQRAGLQRGPWRLSGRLGRRSRA